MTRLSGAHSSALLAVVSAAALLFIVQDYTQLQAATVTSRKPKNDGQNCTNHLQVIDRCSSLATYSYTTSFNQYPNNSQEFKASCDRIGEGLKCLKQHAKCMSPISRRSLNLFTTSRTKHWKKLCTNPNNAEAGEFVKAADCVAKANKKPLMIGTERELIATIQYLALNNTMKWQDRFNTACCAAGNFRSQALKDLEPECGKYRQIQEDMLNSLVGELLETACPEQARLNDVCNKLGKLSLPKSWKTASLTSAAIDLIIALADQPST